MLAHLIILHSTKGFFFFLLFSFLIQNSGSVFYKITAGSVRSLFCHISASRENLSARVGERKLGSTRRKKIRHHDRLFNVDHERMADVINTAKT